MASILCGPRPVRASLALLGAGTAAYVAYAALGLHRNDTLAAIFDNWVYYGLLLGAVGACLARGVYGD